MEGQSGALASVAYCATIRTSPRGRLNLGHDLHFLARRQSCSIDRQAILEIADSTDITHRRLVAATSGPAGLVHNEGYSGLGGLRIRVGAQMKRP